MKQLLLVLVIAIGLAVLAGCGAMGSTSEKGTSEKSKAPSKVSATPIVGATLGEFTKSDGIQVQSVPGSADVALLKVVLEPGGSTGWHHHPGVALVSVKSGALSEYHGGCHKTVYKEGKGFVESPGEVHIVRNDGNVDAVLYATFVIPTGTPPEKLTVSEPQPKNCDVK
jgi:quercetin dioxygenase-like cupin family protein